MSSFPPFTPPVIHTLLSSPVTLASLTATHKITNNHQARERIEKDLGDADSRFRDLGNLLVHVKVKSAKTLPPPVAQNPAAARYAPPPASNSNSGQQPAAAVHCYHGFGSNTWSWTLVQQQIAEKLGALVTAHDMPGFGLTQRWVGGCGRRRRLCACMCAVCVVWCVLQLLFVLHCCLVVASVRCGVADNPSVALLLRRHCHDNKHSICTPQPTH